MKKLFLLVFIFGDLLCNGQSWVWVEQAKNSPPWAQEDVSSMALDTNGNIYEVGFYQGTVAFGSDTLPNQNGSYFFVKYNSSGNVIWAKPSKNSGYSGANGINTDHFGNIYVCGNFDDTVSFDSIQVTSNALGQSCYLAKYTSNGIVQWVFTAKLFNTHSIAEAHGVCTDKYKNVYITGEIEDTVEFGSFILTTPIGPNWNFFVAKLDSLGQVIWVKNPVAASGRCSSYGSGITSDTLGNICLTGFYGDTITIGSYTLITKNQNAFVVKYDSSGNIIWVQSPEIIGSAFCSSMTIAADIDNNYYISGGFGDTVIFGNDTLFGLDVLSAYLVKLSSNGTFSWAKWAAINSTYSSSYGYSVAVDKYKNIYTCGGFQDTINFSGVVLISDTVKPSYIIRLDSMGNGICGTQINNYNDDYNGVAIDPLSNNIYFGGDVWSGECIFSQDTLSSPSQGEYAFLAKWQPCDSNITTSIHPISNKPSISLFPNPSTGIFTISIVGTQNPDSYRDVSGKIEIYNVLGQDILKETLRSTQGDNLIDLSGQPSGIYLCRVLTENGNVIGREKVVVTH